MADPAFRTLLYRYLFFAWLFKDASRGNLFERAAAWRHNQPQARHRNEAEIARKRFMPDHPLSIRRSFHSLRNLWATLGIHRDMLKNLKDFFDNLLAPTGTAPAPEHGPQLAAAVLLVEVMRADPRSTASEREAVLHALRRKFGLAGDELERLLELALTEGRNIYDYHRFTSSLNDHFTQPQKIALVEAMWQVAYADAHLAADENHLISKIAGLLHVTHGEYIGAKMRAKEDADA